jgi:hypothetical protein
VTIGNTNVKPGRRTTMSPGSLPKYRETTGHAIAARIRIAPATKSNERMGDPIARL